MKKIICLTFALVIVNSPLWACDVCGGAAQGGYMGIYPQFAKNVIGIRYSASYFDHPNTELNLNGSSQVSRDDFHTTDLWMRYIINPRFQLLASIPYRKNTRHESERITRISGIGDIQLNGYFVVLNTADSLGRKVKHTLLTGLGVALPTGHYQERDADLSLLPAAFQIGTGAYRFSPQLNYTLRQKALGFNFEASTFLFAENERGYQFGNQLVLGLQSFYWLNKGDISIVPQLGYSLEHFDKDSEFGKERLDTGGSIQFVRVSCDAFYKRLTAQIGAQVPVVSNVGHGIPQAAPRWSVGLGWVF